VVYDQNFDLKCAIDRLAEGVFSPEEPRRYGEIVASLLETDHYQLLADFEDYVLCQQRVDALYQNSSDWTQKAILNVAGMGVFSSDRTIGDYAQDIWGVKSL